MVINLRKNPKLSEFVVLLCDIFIYGLNTIPQGSIPQGQKVLGKHGGIRSTPVTFEFVKFLRPNSAVRETLDILLEKQTKELC